MFKSSSLMASDLFTDIVSTIIFKKYYIFIAYKSILEEMADKALIEQMKRDKAKLDVKITTKYIQQCCACSGKFKEALKPILLECGHFICQTKECRSRKLCPRCDRSLIIKTNPYETLLSFLRLLDQPSENNQAKQYNIYITNRDLSYGKRIFDVSENETIKNIIPQQFLDEDNQKYDYEMAINDHSTLYSKVKEKTIKNYNQFIQQKHPDKNKLYSNRTNFNRTNTIRFLSKFDGGNNS